MAINSNGQVAVRFSVENAEVVRVALEKLGKDGEAALARFDAAARSGAAANDSFAKSLAEVAGATSESKQSLIDTGAKVLETAGHLKLLTVAAYAMSPAFRAFTNSTVTQGLSALGANAGLAARGLGAVASAAGPALSFATRVSVPITAAVGAFAALNAVISRGSELIERYGNAQRELPANVIKIYRDAKSRRRL